MIYHFKKPLFKTHPHLVPEWHPDKNGSLTPSDVTYGSGKRVWWRCAAKGHEWAALVTSRTHGSGCPYCAGFYPSKEHNLQVDHPNIAEEWHPIKNGGLTPMKVTPGSHKKAWFVCPKGHEYEMQVKSRREGQGCPYCAGRRLCEDNNLAAVNPELSKQWHPTKNGRLTPKDVTQWTGRKVWWLCGQGHEWQARVSDRSVGKGCRKCRWGYKRREI